MLKSTQLATNTCRRVTAPTGVAVVGVDHPSRRMLRVLRENLDAEVLWLCNPDRDRLEKYVRRCPGPRIATRIERVLGDPAVEAVFIADPAHIHCRLITQALEADKHVFIQATLASCSAPAEQIADAASAHGRILRCASPSLHSAPVHTIKQVVSTGEMGELDFVSSSRAAPDAGRRDLDVITDLGPRELFVLLYWLTELPATVRAAGRAVVQPGVADIACITLTFASGLLANLELSRVGPPALSRTVLVGRQGMAVYDESAEQQVRLFDRGRVRTAAGDGEEGHTGRRPGEACLQLGLREIVAPPRELRDPLGIEVDAFITAVRHGERAELHTALARRVLRVSEAAELSLSNGGRNVALGQSADVKECAEAHRRPAAGLPAAGLHAVS